jgi:hypothetical protein
LGKHLKRLSLKRADKTTTMADKKKTTEANEPAIVEGQVLYREIMNRHRPTEIKEYVVGRVARKYFYLIGMDKYPIEKDTLQYVNKEYSQLSFNLYRSKQEIYDRISRARVLDAIRRHFDWSGNYGRNTLEQLSKAAEVLGVSWEEFKDTSINENNGTDSKLDK